MPFINSRALILLQAASVAFASMLGDFQGVVAPAVWLFNRNLGQRHYDDPKFVVQYHPKFPHSKQE